MSLRHTIKREELQRLYWDDGWTIEKLAEHYGCSATSIRRRMNDLGISFRPRGPQVSRYIPHKWSAPIAYVVGLIVTDGNLSKDGRHLSLVSKDYNLLKVARDCLGIDNAIRPHKGGLGHDIYHLQWGDRNFYDWLLGIGLLPAKSLRLGRLTIPDDYLADFMRGCIDGDGTILAYTDRYNIYKGKSYSNERLLIKLVSASQIFMEWLQQSIARVTGAQGALILAKTRYPNYAPLWILKYAKHESIRLLRWMYYAPEVPCLARKRAKALPFLSIST